MGVKPMHAETSFSLEKTPSSPQPIDINRLTAFNVPTPSYFNKRLHSGCELIAFSNDSSCIEIAFKTPKYCSQAADRELLNSVEKAFSPFSKVDSIAPRKPPVLAE